ncbi:MAG: ABC transporter substrate-binding protein [Gemmatimonadetes bacterium]|uniref:ABC transporter substrate-binding protein n=1 Tax=Candidatus Kutchimonas denitrificans TaxID=3056748 RepID=A0AAE5CCI1_9BACT|nr:ABC transporter substrate-binding protein [Gemmatimonadota bacterium]NIR75675.1 ABC transporter substrate-binding protein [Candidatus Kutchimonas denitrificans]NIS00287.1 ABC transporter substrate-binding protein [Gemmatimonadota bacterium]NIT65946.1 ABC transporter substrate-binding protein [Gemmatimonadota bacterium]NIU53643.1 ABC transporter substrate-binding protein [Gemmatimonadota bacterium]
MRITSLYPTATEISFAIGAGDEVVGVSHACDYPPGVEELKSVTKPRFDVEELSSAQIYEQKMETNKSFGSIYRLDETSLWGLRSDVLLTQGPGEFTLVSLQGVRAIAEGLNPRPNLMILYPRHLDDVLDDHARVGLATGHLQEAKELVHRMRERIQAVEDAAKRGSRRQRVAVVQWLDPLLSSSYWVPQLIEIGGGRDVLNTPGLSPNKFEFEALKKRNPEVLVVAPEDMRIERTLTEMPLLTDRPGWWELDAVRRERVYIGDGSVFGRPGPRVIDGLEALAWAIHPDAFPQPSPDVLRPL